jgi:hypothetical protein
MMRFRKTGFAGVRQGRKGVRGVRRERGWKRLIFRFFHDNFCPSSCRGRGIWIFNTQINIFIFIIEILIFIIV